MKRVVDCEREVVLVEDLAPILRRELAKRELCWQREWGQLMQGDSLVSQSFTDGQGINERRVDPVTVTARIAHDAGISAKTLERILTDHTQYVDLDVADRILMALDCHISEVEVYSKVEAYRASKDQVAILRTIARTTGLHVPPPTGSKHIRATGVIPAIRSKMLREQTA